MEKELKNIAITVKDEFRATYDVEMTTATELAKTIDTLFGRIFNDYHKCNLNPIGGMQNNVTGYDLSLSFRPNANATQEQDQDGKFAAFVPVSISSGTTSNKIYDSMKKVSNASKSTTVFTISQPATEILRNLFIDPFVFADQNFTTDPNPKRYIARKLIGEQTVRVNTGYNRFVNIVENVIMHIDVNKVLQLVKGEKNEKGEKLFYRIRPLIDVYANVSNNNGMVPIRSETAIEILRLNGAEWDNFNARIGAIQRTQEMVSPIRVCN